MLQFVNVNYFHIYYRCDYIGVDPHILTSPTSALILFLFSAILIGNPI